MLPFQDATPTPAGDWRHIVRFGRNVASYKFALAQVLLDLAARQQTFVPLPDLAFPYAATLCEHLQVEDRQSTSAQSQFLDACRSRNRGELDDAQLAELTVRLGFVNVIDAFHVSRGGQPTQTRFFTDERAGRQGITLTDHLLELANGQQAKVLPREVDARWNLVQLSWGVRLGTRLVSSFEMTPDKEAVDLYAPARLRRGPITGVRAALSGYQDGRCAYCQGTFTDIGTSRVAVDHVLPFVLMTRGWPDGDLHQVWNLVLACYACNSAKSDRPPAAAWMPWLERRGEYLIASHHPLRETLISQLGPDPGTRHQTLARRHRAATELMVHSWTPPRPQKPKILSSERTVVRARPPVANRNALPTATAYHQHMQEGPHRINWEWEELVLACDLVAQNDWRQLDESDPRVQELSGVLQRMSMHPLESRLPNFRNAAGVARKTNNIATVHPGYVGSPSNGSKLDKEVLDEFIDDYEQMHRFAQSLRQAAENDEPGNASQLVGDEYDSVMEGRYLLRLHRVWERKPALREKKIRSVLAHGGALACEACGFDFKQTYGDRGQGFIECHHVEPLHQTGERANTIRDLALLCSNCHRMIHRKPPWPTPAQLRDLIHGQPPS